MAYTIRIDRNGNIIGGGYSINLANMTKYDPLTNTITDINDDVIWDLAGNATMLSDTMAALDALANNVLTLDNIKPYAPTAPYQPATKGYVDSMASSSGGNVSMTKNIPFLVTEDQDTFIVDYILGGLNVFVNGLQIDPSAYQATDGETIILPRTVPPGTVVNVVVYGGADVYNKTQMDTLLSSKVDISDTVIGTY